MKKKSIIKLSITAVILIALGLLDKLPMECLVR